jgi:Fic family protein
MDYISVAQLAQRWGLTARAVRKYCSEGKIDGAFLVGKTWNIPESAQRPPRKNAKTAPPFSDNQLLNVLKQEKDAGVSGGIYHFTQVSLTYNSNHIEGSRLTEDETRYIFETNTVGLTVAKVDDIVETVNHFRCIDIVIDAAKKPLAEALIKQLHRVLKTGTRDASLPWFNVGEYKERPNQVGGEDTCPPKEVAAEVKKLLAEYNGKQHKALIDILDFHQRLEKIHPFQDGNGRVGRLIMFKECLAHNVVPFIIDDQHKIYYYRGLKEWQREKGYLTDTCLSCQDIFRARMRYFGIEE